MELSALLLLVAFRNQIEEPDLETGLLRIAQIAGGDLDPSAFDPVLAGALAEGYISDPVQLPPGALQCPWHLGLTPLGVERVLGLLRQHGKSADELLADAAARRSSVSG